MFERLEAKFKTAAIENGWDKDVVNKMKEYKIEIIINTNKVNSCKESRNIVKYYYKQLDLLYAIYKEVIENRLAA